jgi:hypothetical protein
MFFSYFNSFVGRLVMGLAILTILSNPCIAESPSPYPSKPNVFISFTNEETNTDLSDSPRINMGFNGSGHHAPFIMDTGSVGIIASADIFTPAPNATNLGTGRQIYSSSGIIDEGTWWTADQDIYDKDGKLIATASVPVLLVTSIRCTDDARSCEPNSNPRGISVMGIGFARESPEQQHGTPDYNAFLNLTKIRQDGKLKSLPKNWCNGYVVTPTGVYLGLTSKNTANAGFVKLLPWTTYSTSSLSEWMAAPMTISVDGTSGNGNILMDTGVAAGFLTPPAGAVLGTLVQCPGSTLVECLDNGSVVDVYLPNQTNPVAFYTFTVGESGNSMQPDGVHIVSGSNVFFNTTRHVLAGLNFIYDNTNGYIGYIWNGNSSGSVGYVHTAILASTTSLSSSLNPSKKGQEVTFTATVVGVTPLQTPTGGITFIVNSTQEYVALDNNGQASFSTSELSKGKHSIVAKYSGDSIFLRSTSPTLSQKVKKS